METFGVDPHAVSGLAVGLSHLRVGCQLRSLHTPHPTALQVEDFHFLCEYNWGSSLSKYLDWLCSSVLPTDI